MKAAGYVRVSTEEQATTGYSLDAQEALIVREVLQRDWQLVDVFRDEGVSGKSLDRPALRDALELIASREVDVLIVAKFDRLTRNVGDFVALMDWLEQVPAAMLPLDFPQLDTTGPGGKAMAQIFVVFAEWERNAISQRTKDALAERKAQGLPVSGPTIPEPVRARIRALRGDGLTYQQICDILNAERVPTARGGVRWESSSVWRLLNGSRPGRRRPAALPKIPRRKVKR